MTLDQPSDLVPLIVIATAILSGLAWLIRAQVQMHKAFQPNGGPERAAYLAWLAAGNEPEVIEA